jgi:tRNA 2-selenouridine synthase
MTSVATVAQLDEFDEVIDVRTPAEFQEDHIPGAVNCPVLYDEERARVGTLYKQVSSFEAKKVGAAFIARNIAHHIEEYFAAKPKHWRPLVYCWRGGKRSGSMAHILSEIGWKVARLEGGYKAYRKRVVEDLQRLPLQFPFRVVCGPTGSGKSRFLQALAKCGAQALDLEMLAAHRGSVLGNLPDAAQPAQKMFESMIWNALRHFDPAKPVYVEGESKKIGMLRVPDALIHRMWEAGTCVRLEVDAAQRVSLLKEEYHHFLEDPRALMEKVECLKGLHSQEQIERWRQMADAGQWDQFVLDMLQRHYDPAYDRSMIKHYPQLNDGPVLRPTDISAMGYEMLARAHLATA